jgi:hypothetical protein
MARIRLAAAAALLAATLSAGEAFACKCGSSSYSETIARVPVAFEGRVESSRLSGGMRVMTVAVTRPVKGGVSGRVEIVSRSSRPACGWSGRVGESYTFGLTRLDGRLHARLCTMAALNGDTGEP